MRYQPNGLISMTARLYGLHHFLIGQPISTLANAMERELVREPTTVTVPGTEFLAAVAGFTSGEGGVAA